MSIHVREMKKEGRKKQARSIHVLMRDERRKKERSKQRQTCTCMLLYYVNVHTVHGSYGSTNGVKFFFC